MEAHLDPEDPLRLFVSWLGLPRVGQDLVKQGAGPLGGLRLSGLPPEKSLGAVAGKFAGDTNPEVHVAVAVDEAGFHSNRPTSATANGEDA